MGESIESRDDAWLRLNPRHPGRAIKEACIGPDAADCGRALTVSAAAERLGVDRKTLSRVINGRSGILPQLALKLKAVGWGDAQSWAWRQANYDLAQARKRLDGASTGAVESRRASRQAAGAS